MVGLARTHEGETKGGIAKDAACVPPQARVGRRDRSDGRATDRSGFGQGGDRIVAGWLLLVFYMHMR